MRRNLAMRVQYYLTTRQQNRRRAVVLRCLAVVVVFATAYALIIPAVTQSNKLLCGKEAHEHTEACWTVEMVAPQPELICTVGQDGEIVIHTHDSRCYDMTGKLICPLPERELHIHSSDCYREHRELICEERQSLGHTHGPSCYTYTRSEELVCGQEAASGHVHTDACYTVEKSTSPACGQKEGNGHTHTDACYRVERSDTPACGQETEGHTHTDACYTTEQGTSPTCGKAETEGHTHTDACYTEETRELLTCGQPESSDVLDEEGNVIEAGHSHSGSCYTVETEEVLTCGQKEGGGHTHSDACYPAEKVLTCTQEEGGSHTHTDACYPEKRTLVCEEGEQGHTHTDACYPEEKILICEEEEQGHIHSDSCYEWTKELRCQEEERESGHIHTDECYEFTELLACQREELVLHTHTDKCYEYIYDEETGEVEEMILTCGKPEIVLHQHTDECFFTPEGEPVEAAVLSCGIEEHVHAEECYMDIVPKEENLYFCGQNEHIHTDECYFESGELRCTLPEHIHSLVCLEEKQEIPGEPENPEEPKEPAAVELDDYFEYESEAFHVIFHVTGPATLIGEDSAPLFQDSGMGHQPEGPADESDISDGGSADSSQPPDRTDASAAPDSTDMAEPDAGNSADADKTSVTSGEIEIPLAQAPVQSGEDSQTEGPEEAAEGPEAAVQPERSVQINFQVTEPDQDSQEYQEIAASVPKSGAEQMILSVLAFSVTSSDGREVDLSQCEIEAEVVFSEELVDALVNKEADTMAIDNDVDIDSGEESEETAAPEIMLGAFSSEAPENGTTELSSVVVNETAVAGPVSMLFQVSPRARGVAFAAQAGQFPNYTVEYYALLNRPVLENETGVDGTDRYVELDFIDTSAAGNNRTAPVLPQNGTLNTQQMRLMLDRTSRKVVFQLEETQIYRDAPQQYDTMAGNGDGMTTKDLSDVVDKFDDGGGIHYSLAQVRVTQPDGAVQLYPEEPIMNSPVSLDPYFDGLKYTNSLDAVDEHTVGIAEGTQIRLIYRATGNRANYSATFFDYDITNGPNDGKSPVNTVKHGINDTGNYKGSGAKLAFGNGQTKMGLETEQWNGNNLNMSNGTNNTIQAGKGSFGDCTFGLTSQVIGGKLMFSADVDAPNLFGNGTVPGRTVYNDQNLVFDRSGDTYTLTAVSGVMSESNLESFSLMRQNWNKTKWIISNNFWPMDTVTNTDPHFGGESKPKFNDTDNTLPDSDDGEDHNAYFGMHFTVQFTLPEGYVGPLEYYFYGDDDMWVFLDGRMVCDIGGVHSSVGEYVDLWDYIPGGKEGHEEKSFLLDFYYTERGASGSTCWMKFTLPNMISVPSYTEANPGDNYLRLEKVVDSSLDSDYGEEYTFRLSLFNTADTYDIYKYSKGAEAPEESKELLGQIAGNQSENSVAPKTAEIKLKHGEYIEIRGLPKRVTFTIEEVGQRTDFQVTYSVEGKDRVKDIRCTGGMSTGQSNVICTNYYRYELPETGGPGVNLYAWAGTLLIMAAGCLWYKKRTHRGGAKDET